MTTPNNFDGTTTTDYAIRHVAEQAKDMTYDEFVEWYMQTIYFNHYALNRAITATLGNDLARLYDELKKNSLNNDRRSLTQ